ncbi:MAG: 3-dehydroquinate synthase [Microgenomates group bacterium]
MKTNIVVNITRSNSVYPIQIGTGVINDVVKDKAMKRASKVCVITDTVLAALWLPHLMEVLGKKEVCVVTIPTGEKNKTLATLEDILNRMIAHGLNRNSVVVTLGGGVVCDIGGLAAGLFMRGIPVIHIPTTLLAQVDASMGGKTAVDMNGLKNMIGIFHQPEAVYVDIETLSTLPLREHHAGCAEIIKHGVIGDIKLLKMFKTSSIKMTKKNLIQMILMSCQVKKTIIQQDELEKKGERKKLNFGHTVGHAVEAMSLKGTTPLLHGEAVALGMVAEARMSVIMGHLSIDEEKTIHDCIRNVGLPTTIPGGSIEEIVKLMEHDKKNSADSILFSLPMKIGHVAVDCVVPHIIMREAVNHIIKKII